jgi:hypothetical protein
MINCEMPSYRTALRASGRQALATAPQRIGAYPDRHGHVAPAGPPGRPVRANYYRAGYYPAGQLAPVCRVIAKRTARASRRAERGARAAGRGDVRLRAGRPELASGRGQKA